ncbi:uncharacterized protein LOC144373023 [Ictidomys tridecemlineatus]
MGKAGQDGEAALLGEEPAPQHHWRRRVKQESRTRSSGGDNKDKSRCPPGSAAASLRAGRKLVWGGFCSFAFPERSQPVGYSNYDNAEDDSDGGDDVNQSGGHEDDGGGDGGGGGDGDDEDDGGDDVDQSGGHEDDGGGGDADDKDDGGDDGGGGDEDDGDDGGDDGDGDDEDDGGDNGGGGGDEDDGGDDDGGGGDADDEDDGGDDGAGNDDGGGGGDEGGGGGGDDDGGGGDADDEDDGGDDGAGNDDGGGGGGDEGGGDGGGGDEDDDGGDGEEDDNNYTTKSLTLCLPGVLCKTSLNPHIIPVLQVRTQRPVEVTAHIHLTPCSDGLSPRALTQADPVHLLTPGSMMCIFGGQIFFLLIWAASVPPTLAPRQAVGVPSCHGGSEDGSGLVIQE